MLLTHRKSTRWRSSSSRLEAPFFLPVAAAALLALLAASYATLVQVSYTAPLETLRVDFRRNSGSWFEVKRLQFTFSATSITGASVDVYNQNLARCNNARTTVTITFYLKDGSTKQVTVSFSNIPRNTVATGSAALSPGIAFSLLVKVDVFAS